MRGAPVAAADDGRRREGGAVTPGVNTGMPGTHILVPDAVGR